MLHTVVFNFPLAARMKSGGAEWWGFLSESRYSSTHAWWGNRQLECEVPQSGSGGSWQWWMGSRAPLTLQNNHDGPTAPHTPPRPESFSSPNTGKRHHLKLSERRRGEGSYKPRTALCSQLSKSVGKKKKPS